jgi:hypothetical protein
VIKLVKPMPKNSTYRALPTSKVIYWDTDIVQGWGGYEDDWECTTEEGSVCSFELGFGWLKG